MKYFSFFFILFLVSTAWATDVRITVEGLRNGDGQLRLALFDKAGEFPRGEDIQDLDIPAKAGDMTAIFKNLKPGRYALAIHHDENLNKSMDTNFIGLPLEGYGFSNNAPVFFGPPDFDDAAFEVGEQEMLIKLRVVY